MIKIDQDILCDFCKDHNNSRMDNCEGSQCEEMAELYLDENGISDPSQGKRTFEKLNVNNIIYFLDIKLIVPEIKKRKLISIAKLVDNSIDIRHADNYIRIPEKSTNLSSIGQYHLYRADAQEELQKLCLERILALSKAIGSNQGEDSEDQLEVKG